MWKLAVNSSDCFSSKQEKYSTGSFVHKSSPCQCLLVWYSSLRHRLFTCSELIDRQNTSPQIQITTAQRDTVGLSTITSFLLWIQTSFIISFQCASLRKQLKHHIFSFWLEKSEKNQKLLVKNILIRTGTKWWSSFLEWQWKLAGGVNQQAKHKSSDFLMM